MSGSPRCTIAFAVAGALALIAAPALAQKYGDIGDPYYAAPGDEEVVVTAPGVTREYTGRRTSSGIPIDNLTAQRVVDTADLDLRYDGDVAELHRRIADAASDACRDIENATAEPLITSQRQCVRDAERDAMAQADDLIWSVRG